MPRSLQAQEDTLAEREPGGQKAKITLLSALQRAGLAFGCGPNDKSANYTGTAPAPAGFRLPGCGSSGVVKTLRGQDPEFPSQPPVGGVALPGSAPVVRFPSPSPTQVAFESP